MGNDQSHHHHLKGLQIDKNAVEINDFWSLYNAEIPKDDNSTLLSIFQEETVVNGQLWITQTPLRRAAKNLMIYRHPCILKYITSWDQGSKKYLATERCQPLTSVIQLQNDIQICLGLKNILSSLIFLVEQAKSHHLNVCLSSIYVNSDGEWRLGGFEYVWKSKEITKSLLDLSKSYRYKNAIDKNETKYFCNSNRNDVNDNDNDNDDSDIDYNNFGIEQYSFATLCDELLKNSLKKSQSNISTTTTTTTSTTSSKIPYIKEFYDYCLIHLKHSNIRMRPKLSAILLHPYFNHEFIMIHTFLTELPLKGQKDKQDFFTSLIDSLRYFDETIIASQIGTLLLSRMVLLDITAKLCVTPYILKTKSNITSALFSNHTYIKYIIPQIKKIFYVRDTQIRLILLEYFNDYIKLLTKDELKNQILPNLLLGIKDTNDILVEKTLRCLADLIPILGSKIVIGNNYRKKLFADGRPQHSHHQHQQGMQQHNLLINNNCCNDKNYLIEPPRSITPVINISDDYNCVSASPLPPNDDIDNDDTLYNNNNNDDTISESYNISMTPTQTIATATTTTIINDNRNINNIENILLMPSERRLSPDGGEDIQNLTVVDGNIDNNNDDDDDDDDAWSDWDNDEEINRITMNNEIEATRTMTTTTTVENVTVTTVATTTDTIEPLKAAGTATENSHRTSSTYTNQEGCNTNLINKKLQTPKTSILSSSSCLVIESQHHHQHQYNQQQKNQSKIDQITVIKKSSPNHHNKSSSSLSSSVIDIADDINSLDIKNQKFKLKSKNDEIDYFKDMEPIIQSSSSSSSNVTNSINIIDNTNQITNTNTNTNPTMNNDDNNDDDDDGCNIEIDKNRFAIKIDDQYDCITDCGNGWKDDDDDGDGNGDSDIAAVNVDAVKDGWSA